MLSDCKEWWANTSTQKDIGGVRSGFCDSKQAVVRSSREERRSLSREASREPTRNFYIRANYNSLTLQSHVLKFENVKKIPSVHI